MSAHPTLVALLDVLATLDEDVLTHIYQIERGSTASLDAAVYAWRDAGRPGAPVDEDVVDPLGGATADDLRAILDANLGEGGLPGFAYNLRSESWEGMEAWVSRSGAARWNYGIGKYGCGHAKHALLGMRAVKAVLDLYGDAAAFKAHMDSGAEPLHAVPEAALATPPDARAILGDGAFHAYRDCGASARMDGEARPTEEGAVGDAMREGWDDEDRRQSARTSRQAGTNARRWGRPREAETLTFDEAEWLAGWDAEDARIALAEDRDVGGVCGRLGFRERRHAAAAHASTRCDMPYEDLLHAVAAPNVGSDIGDEDCEGALSPVERFFDGDMECEQHAGVAWPHDDCNGPGMPWRDRPARCDDEDDEPKVRIPPEFCTDCTECPPEGHHFGDAYIGTAEGDPEHPAAKAGHAVWYGCKHCDAFVLDLDGADDEDDGAPDAAGEAGGLS